MKKIFLSALMAVMVCSIGFAQTAKKAMEAKDKKYESVEVSMDKVPAKVMTAMKENGIEKAHVMKAYEVKKDDGKIYKFKVKSGDEKMKYKFDANGKLIKKEKWSKSKDSSTQ